jgi:hypothetical protein
MASTKLSLSNFTKLATMSIVPVLIFGTIFMGFRANDYIKMSSQIDTNRNQLNALEKINKDLSVIKSKKDIKKRISNPNFSFINKELLKTAQLKKLSYLKYVNRAKATGLKTTHNLDQRKFNKEVNSVFAYVNILAGELTAKNYWARKDFSSIKKNIIATIKNGKTSLIRWKNNTREIQALKDRIEVTNIKNNYKRSLLKKFSRIISSSNKVITRLSNQRSSINALNILLIKVNDFKMELPIQINQLRTKMDSVYRSFYQHALSDLIKVVVMFIGLIVLMYFKINNSFKKSMTELSGQINQSTSTADGALLQLEVLANDTVVATAILDAKDNILWSNQKFLNLFSLKKKHCYNWKKIYKNDVFDYSKETGVIGAVKLRSDLNKEYIMKSRTGKYSQGERRIVQIWAIEEYYLELAGKNNILTIPRESVPPQLSEVGNLLDELLIKMSVFFDNFQVNVDLTNKLPTLTTINPEHLVLSMANVLKGLIFYLNHSRQGSIINISYNKVNSKFIFKIEAVNARIDLRDIDKDLKFNNKSYHSLGYYLTEGEEFLENYGAKIGVKNFLASDDEVSISVIEIELDEAINVNQGIKAYKNLQFTKDDKRMEIEGLV